MKVFRIIFGMAVSLLVFSSCGEQQEQPYVNPYDEEIDTTTQLRGFYKDLFMDGGIMLTSRQGLPIAGYLNLEMEHFASAGTDSLHIPGIDTVIQNQLLSHSDIDENGVLLYPDGSPRFKLLYMNGGKATSHGRSLNSRGSKGLKRIREYYEKGGAYVGTCAGAFITAKGTGSAAQISQNPNFLSIWDGYAYGTGMTDTYTDMTVEPGSPLLRYYDFGGDMKVENVRHNGGCYMSPYVKNQTEILMRYDCLAISDKCHGQVSCWAYKKDIYSGRLVACGSHPEGVTDGERRDLFASFCLYAMDGIGIATIKDTLKNGVVCEMTKLYSENDPTHARIGDKQYHHFVFWIENETAEATITVNGAAGSEGCNLQVFAKKGGFAFDDNTEYKAVAAGTNQTLEITGLKHGFWYVSVYCPDTVTSTLVRYTNPEETKEGYYYQYSGNTTVLNGVPYTIQVTW